MTTISAMATMNPSIQAHPIANATGNDGNSAGNTSSITANDFLSLLVAEMKNQDPTAQTDPNEYINQLVQVNSLQQLIQINENLSSALGTSGGSATTDVSARRTGVFDGAETTSAITQPAGKGGVTSANEGVLADVRNRIAEGNLGVPAPNPAAQRVAQSLGAH